MILRLTCLFFALHSCALAQQEIPSLVRLRVLDDSGAPVTNATVAGCFLDASPSGSRDPFGGTTDADGLFAAQGKSLLGLYAKFTCSGYYPTKIEKAIESIPQPQGKTVRPDRWHTEIPVLLKKIKSPIPMYVRGIDNIKLRETSQVKDGRVVLSSVVGYDLFLGDRVEPYGAGKCSDVEFRWKMDIHSKDRNGIPEQYDTSFELRFPQNETDGICRGKPNCSEDGQTGSACLSDYEAPQDGYTNTISIFSHVHNRKEKRVGNDDGHYLFYYRVRTQTNETGQVTNALYGKICGQINRRFSYYLNPMPNDRNVEHDPKRNLFRQE